MVSRLLCITGFLLASFGAKAQLLFPESFVLIMDTTQHIRGSLTPAFKLQTQKELLVELENTADLAFRYHGHSLTFANRFELSRFGEEVLLSGGYVYGKFRQEKERRFMLEYYGQVHWAEARGMERKYAAGVNARWGIFQQERLALYTGIGPFYEYERWNYKAVPDDRLPNDLLPEERELLKVGAYVGYKQWVLKDLLLDISVYYQQRPEVFFDAPRFGSSSRIGVQLNRYLQLALIYQNIHDAAPVVPIDPWFHKVIATVTVTF